MGHFNGIFFAIYKSSRVTGNIISSLVLDYFAWTSTTMISIFTCIGLCGTILLCMLPTIASPTQDDDCEPSTRMLTALKVLALDKRMMALAPVFFLNGLQQGYATSEFTSNFVRLSLGSTSIGYVTAVFGVVNVAGSYAIGKLADRFDPVIGHAVGYGVLIVSYGLSYGFDVVQCDKQWALVVVLAVLLSIGDACSTTLTKGLPRWNVQSMTAKVLGQALNSVKAFSVFTIYQSGTVSASFFLLKYMR
ncbi:hypothetical protein H310_00167 [Aphanomyces invadans]|uniref:Major facilitator superfamily (MFS) profile domain-containing protein n=1 Tax=Aphanomyces invadans TaxID=157072 RepID=A0A024UUN7_9STRA|nr:hypothetical protein H310_00167 [Aphanomyces invadans]ETW09637.1 hypothetical protein H310_00167 [Aphanomyces invadans]|eukprot:XP_008861048.1 hypothetical protein H310_00167 [Aphanomyces invadans]